MLIEAVLTAVIVLLMMIFVGIPIFTIIEWVLIVLFGLLVLTILFFVLFFLFTSVSLLFYKRVKGVFVRFDDSSRWERAVYSVEGNEYICRFPAESILRNSIYKEDAEDRTCMLLISRSDRKSAYDRHSLMIIAVGTVVSVILIAAVLIAVLFYVRVSRLY